MFWADRIVAQIRETDAAREAVASRVPLVVRDEKTLSGRVHVGSMRGVAIHGVVSEVLTEAGIPNRYLYELNDFDPFDSIPGYLDEARYKEHLGKPLYTVPSPEEGYANYAEYFGAEFVGVHTKAGFAPEYYRAYADLYKAGKMDTYIRTALERATQVRRILKEVSGSVKDESWLPISVVCPSCGKMMTTRAYDFDGETVAYSCDRSPDECVPCGASGRTSPFRGGGKLFWKVDWAAKWGAMSVSVEGGGKDHSTKGGSRDVANHIAREIFGYEPPFDIPYEFFLVGGKKMSSSKGRGSSAKDMADLFPPSVFRLLLIGKEYSQQIDVDPEGDSVPRHYDWYDDLAEGIRSGRDDDFARIYTLSQLPEEQATPPIPWNMRFSEVSFVAQMPHLDIVKEAEAVKGDALTTEEKEALGQRAEYALFWLSTYAPERYVYRLQDTTPTLTLTDSQKNALRALHTFLSEGEKTGEELHEKLHALKTEVPIEPKALFSALYQSFLGRESGPKAGWFLSGLPRELVLARLKEVSQ